MRLRAAAAEPFLARAERSAAVMFSAAVLPPRAPVLRAISRIAARTSRGILMATSRYYTLGGMDIAKAEERVVFA